jgi:hypothetical protein
MTTTDVSEYNSDQHNSFLEIRKVLSGLSSPTLEHLRRSIEPYLRFREEVKAYQDRFFGAICKKACFDTRLSACCSFESIITFFADQVVTAITSTEDEVTRIIETTARPNHTGKCVYLGEAGCIWKVPPVSCAMFLCDAAKQEGFAESPEAEPIWRELQEKEKEFTWPTKLVVFDELEDFFLHRGVRSRHMFFHTSPGLLRLKAKAGLKSRCADTGCEIENSRRFAP